MLYPRQDEDKKQWSTRIQTVLDVTEPLVYERKNRLPLYLWPAMDPGDVDAETAEYLLRELDRRGIGLITSWNPNDRKSTLWKGLIIGKAQQKLGLSINVNATRCLYSFYTDEESTAHFDTDGRTFRDESFGRKKLGCPFTLENRKHVIKEQVEYFTEAYAREGLSVNFIFADWEVDGPLEVNRAHETSKRCVRCRQNIPGIEDFTAFQEGIRELRSRLQKEVFTDPVLSRFPDALIGNYAVYPHDGYRYWYDYFEYYVEGQPYKREQNARYRQWYDDYPATGYTFAMPVVYPWYPIFNWYDFTVPDYRWFYGMMQVVQNVCTNTPNKIPIISFLHWHTVWHPPQKNPDPAVKQLSEEMYQELLWHMLLRGVDGLFLWCRQVQDSQEVRLVHEVYAEVQKYGEFLEEGKPVHITIPSQPGSVISIMQLGRQLLVRRTDFTPSAEPVELIIGDSPISVMPLQGRCQLLTLQ